MTIITVKLFRENPYYYDEYSIDSSILGEKWCSFFLKTNFCRILPFRRVVNNSACILGTGAAGARLGYNGFVYIVDANNREIVYNSNFVLDDERFIYVRDFVKYILGKYKYKTIN